MPAGRPPLNLDKRVLTYFYVTKQLTIKAVAHKLDCTPPTVKRYLKKYGIPRRSRAVGYKNEGNVKLMERAAPRRIAMKILRKEGMTLQQIADAYGLTRQRVHQIIKKEGQ